MKSPYTDALDALARRSYSARDLERWLAKRVHPPEEVGPVIERLVANGLLDDAAYARAFTRSRIVGRGMSRRRVQAELTRRGVARETADAAIAEVVDDEGIDERALVEAAATKKVRSLAKLEPAVRRRRLLAFLVRRGFDSGLVRDAVAKLTRSTAS